jgi:PTS system ascorbate-specific IIC component
MLALVFLLSLVVGPAYVEKEVSGGQNFIIFGILTALGFTVGVLILLYGVRLFLEEMIPAFKGFAKKIVPGAIPALDIPVLFVYGPTALIAGFIMGLIGQFAAILLCAALQLPTPIPSMIPAFFISGGAAILANHYAGKRAAIITGFLWSFVDFMVASLVYKFDVFGLVKLGISNQIFHSLDGMTVGTLIRAIGSVFGL